MKSTASAIASGACSDEIAGCARLAVCRFRFDPRRGVLRAIARAPESARRRPNPYAEDPGAVLAGKKLFLQHCAECHGANARGRGKAANLHMPDVQKATPGELEWLLRNGNLPRRMPAWSGLPEERRWQLVTYIKSLH